MQTHSFSLETPIGPLTCTSLDGRLQKITFGRLANRPTPADKKIENAFNAYFENPATDFNLPFDCVGTEFQQRVWQTLLTIPAGRTRTYGSLAAELETGPRAIGQACRTNPLLIIIPCHRIIAANGVGGYSGKNEKWIAIKRWLLNHEQMRYANHDRETQYLHTNHLSSS